MIQDIDYLIDIRKPEAQSSMASRYVSFEGSMIQDIDYLIDNRKSVAQSKVASRYVCFEGSMIQDIDYYLIDIRKPGAQSSMVRWPKDLEILIYFSLVYSCPKGWKRH